MDEAQATAPHGMRTHLPVLNWLPNYPARWLRFDLVAGLTAAVEAFVAQVPDQS
jgi:MFS superfamily sulfate permease-like transporter